MDARVTPAEAAPASDPIFTSRARIEPGPPRQFLSEALVDLHRSVQLAPTLFAMQLRARRRANLLGWLWLLLPTLLTLAIGISFERRGSFALPDTQIPYAAFVTIGVAAWQSFAEALVMPLRQLQMHRFSITRARMPLEAPILAGVMEVAAGALIRGALLLLILPAFGCVPGLSLVALPVLMAGLVALALFIGLIAAPAGMLVEDAGRALAVLVGLWMIASPVAYPVPPWLWRFNPAAPLLDGIRACLAGFPVIGGAFAAAAVSLFLLLPAWAWLRLSRHHLIDRVA